MCIRMYRLQYVHISCAGSTSRCNKCPAKDNLNKHNNNALQNRFLLEVIQVDQQQASNVSYDYSSALYIGYCPAKCTRCPIAHIMTTALPCRLPTALQRVSAALLPCQLSSHSAILPCLTTPHPLLPHLLEEAPHVPP